MVQDVLSRRMEVAADTHRRVAVVMQRTPLASRWADAQWEACGVVADDADAQSVPRVLFDRDGLRQVLHPGHRIVLQRHEAEGYYLNVTSPAPKVFVLWRITDAGEPRPERLTVSYHEGARWADSGEPVDGVALPPELLPWIADYAARHYEPEPPKKKRYASNRDKGRMGHSGP